MEFHGDIKFLPTGSTGDVPTQQANGTLAMATPSGGAGLPWVKHKKITSGTITWGSTGIWQDVDLTSPTDSLEFTGLDAGDYLVMGVVHCGNSPSAYQVDVRVNYNGSNSGMEFTGKVTASAAITPIHFSEVVTLPGASQTIKIEAKTTDTSGKILMANLTVMKVDLN